MTTASGQQFSQYTDQLRSMAEVLRDVAETSPSGAQALSIDQLLRSAADVYGTTPAQMKYALSFAGVKHLVKIDYDSSTVTAIPS